MKQILRKNILITGGNRGIGYGIAEHFLKENNFQDKHIIITSRSLQKAKEAEEKLISQTPSAKGHLSSIQLDITDKNSIKKLKKEIEENHKQLSILYNNAGLMFKELPKDKEARKIQFDKVFNTNVYGMINLTEELLDLMAEPGHIINLSSRMLPFKKRLEDFNKINNVEQLKELAKEYEKSFIDDTLEKEGWKNGFEANYGAYPVSKQFVDTYTIILSKRLKEEERNIKVNCVCPGWCKTDMGGSQAPRTYYQGSETPYWMAGFENSEQTGKLFKDLKEFNTKL